jgi:transposase
MSRERQLLSKAEQAELLQAYMETRDGPLRTRYQAVRLYGMGYAVDEIIQVTGCSVSRLRAWYACYQRAGPPGLVDKRVGGNHRYLTPAQKADLAERLQLYTPAQVLGEAAATADGHFWTVSDVQQVVARWYNVTYKSLTSYRSLLQECGFTYQKSQAVFKSRKEQDVAEFSAALEKKADGFVARGTPHRDSGAR